MKVVDLTYPISPQMPVYPGTEPPVLTPACSIEQMGFKEKKITLYSHTGTHMDAPAHIIPGAKTLDALPIEHFYGKAALLDLSGGTRQLIGVDECTPHREIIRNVEFLLMRTGWGRYWGGGRYFSDYPVLSSEAAEWLGGFDLKGVGLDTLSADAPESRGFPIHRAFLGKDMIILENLSSLDKLPRGPFMLSCFPLKFEDADGSPVRAVAFVE